MVGGLGWGVLKEGGRTPRAAAVDQKIEPCTRCDYPSKCLSLRVEAVWNPNLGEREGVLWAVRGGLGRLRRLRRWKARVEASDEGQGRMRQGDCRGGDGWVRSSSRSARRGDVNNCRGTR